MSGMSRTVAGQEELVESEELFDIVELFAIIDAGEIVLGLLGKLREEVEVQRLGSLSSNCRNFECGLK